MSGFTEGHAARGGSIFLKSLELYIALFFLLVDVLLSNVKATKASSYMLQTVPILKTTVPYKLYVKGPVTFDWLSEEGWIWFFSFSDAQAFHFNFWQQETELFISQKDTDDSY